MRIDSVENRGSDTLHRESAVRRVVRRVAAVLDVDELRDRLDLSGTPASEQWEVDAVQAGCRQLGVATRRLDSLTTAEAMDMLREGLAVIVPHPHGDFTILERQQGRNVEMTSVNGSLQHGSISTGQLSQLLDENSSHVLVAQRELACQSLADGSDGNQHSESPTPLTRFWRLLKLEANDLGTVILFALVSGVLALAAPLAVESLVNVVSWGTYLQPLVVLSLILLASLGLAGILRILQTVVVEIIQRRQFVRIVGDLAHRFPRAKRSHVREHYPRELANRVFDIMTIQKATAVLLLDGVSIVLTTCLGMVLLSFYHPFLLGFNIVLLITMISITWLLGRDGIRTSIDESIAKYKIAHWLQDVISFPGAFKVNGGEELAIERANSLAADYLDARDSQFRVVIRQVTFAIGLQALASTALLGLGGWLVIGGQLTLGQLVASELVVTVVVGAFAKAGKSLEKFYDLMAGIDKVGHLLDIPIDARRGRLLVSSEPAKLDWTELQLQSGPNRCRVPAGSLAPGKTLAVLGNDLPATSMFADAVAGLENPESGVVTIADMDATRAAGAGGGRLLAAANNLEVFHASVAENVELGRPGIGRDRVREVLKAVGLWDTIHRLPQALDTLLETDGYPLSRDQVVRLTLARALAARPRLLVVDGLLDSLAPDERTRIWSAALETAAPCTAVLITNDPHLAATCDQQMRLDR